MIVKIQVPIVTMETEPKLLIYNQRRDYEVMIPLLPEVMDWMKGRPKAFFEIKLTYEGFGFEIVKEVAWRKW